MSFQAIDDERRGEVTTDWTRIAAGTLGAMAILWIALFAAYRVDRLDAADRASTILLLVAMPLASHVIFMELTKERLTLTWQLIGVFALGLLWLFFQKTAIEPVSGIRLSPGECVANLALLPPFGFALWLATRAVLYRKRLASVLALQAQTELHLLEAQLAPHTLFNMLNTVYSVLLTDDQKAVPLFLAMSETLRHVVDRTRRHQISVREELDFIENYAALERARNPERVTIAIVAAGNVSVPVPPMLLATLFENAVKHGRFPDGSLKIRVSVLITDLRMQFEVINQFPASNAASPSMGVGHSNVRKRLQILYPGTSTFEVGDRAGIYRALVNITLRRP